MSTDTPKRFFSFYDGDDVEYVIVATDTQHAIDLMDEVGFGHPVPKPFIEAVGTDGKPLVMAELTSEVASGVEVDTFEDNRGRGRIPLTHCDLGEWFTSEV